MSGEIGALEALLSDMAGEMRVQFESFRAARDEAAPGTGPAPGSRADAKAAVEAMSVIIRTLEKIDTLQRQIARDRAEDDGDDADDAAYEQLMARLLAEIDERARERSAPVAAGFPDADLGQLVERHAALGAPAGQGIR